MNIAFYLVVGFLITALITLIVKSIKGPKITKSGLTDDGSIKEPNPPMDDNSPQPL